MSTTTLRAQIEALNLEISAHKQRLITLTASRDALDAELRRVAVFPIDTLPSELLSEIFVCCMPGEPAVATCESMPLPLTRVCKLWAQTAMGTPALWRSLHLAVDDKARYDEQMVGLATTWLQNCKGRLSLGLAVGNFNRANAPSQLSDVSSLIAANGANLSSFNLSFNPESDVPLLLAEQSFLFDNLEELGMRSVQYAPRDTAADRENIAGLVRAFAAMPALQKVRIRYLPPTWLPLPWSQITEFECIMYTGAQVLQALRLLPNLVVFTIELVYNAGAEDRSTLSVVTHRKLRHMSIQEGGGRQPILGILYMLNFLTLPRLETLRPDAVQEETFSAFIHRSEYPPLKVLDFRPVDDEQDGYLCVNDLAKIFSRFDHLYKLRIGQSLGTHDLVDTLASTFTSFPGCLPRLQELEIDGFSAGTGDAGLDDLIWMLEQHRKYSRELRRANVRLNAHLPGVATTWRTIVAPSKHRDVLNQWKADGLEVFIWHRQEPAWRLDSVV